MPYSVEGPREGDVPAVFGNASRAEAELNWKPKKGLEEMCKIRTYLSCFGVGCYLVLQVKTCGDGSQRTQMALTLQSSE